MHITTPITIRFADCDAMGHTNNAKYFTYMEQSRVALFRKLLQLKIGDPLQPENFPFILAEISCRFLKPTYVDEKLIVEARVTEIKNSSFFIEYDLLDKTSGDKVATGRSVQVWYDYRVGKSVAIPDEWRKKLQCHS